MQGIANIYQFMAWKFPDKLKKVVASRFVCKGGSIASRPAGSALEVRKERAWPSVRANNLWGLAASALRGKILRSSLRLPASVSSNVPYVLRCEHAKTLRNTSKELHKEAARSGESELSLKTMDLFVGAYGAEASCNARAQDTSSLSSHAAPVHHAETVSVCGGRGHGPQVHAIRRPLRPTPTTACAPSVSLPAACAEVTGGVSAKTRGRLVLLALGTEQVPQIF